MTDYEIVPRMPPSDALLLVSGALLPGSNPLPFPPVLPLTSTVSLEHLNYRSFSLVADMA